MGDISIRSWELLLDFQANCKRSIPDVQKESWERKREKEK